MSTPDTTSKRALQKLIESLLDNDEASIVKQEDSIVYRIRPTKIGQNNQKSATIDQINKSISEGLLMNDEGLKRIYRKRSDLPRPDLPPSAEANLRTKRINTRVSPEALEEFQECAKHFPSQRAALEAAVQMLSAHLGRDNKPGHPSIDAE